MTAPISYRLSKSLRLWAGSALLCLAGAATAMPVSEYGLILLGDLTASNTQIEGRAFIGGNVEGPASFGTRINKSTSEVSVQIGGNLIGSGYSVQAGYMEVGGTISNSGTMQCNGDGLTQNLGCLRQGSSVQGRVVDLERQLRDDTLNISRLQSNGDVILGNQNTLSYSGSESVAVFELDGTTLLSQNSNWSIDSGSADTVIINVSGDFLAAGGGVNIGTNTNNILWNFHNAESIDFGDLRLNGFVLAPYAEVKGRTYLGGLAAISYEGHGHIGDHLFSGVDLPSTAPAVAVSEPPLWTMLLLGLGLLAVGLRHRVRTA